MQNISVTTSAHPQHKDITLLSVKGFIDTNTAPEFDKAFQTVLSQKKYNLIIDLREATYISSAGWGLFVGEIKRIRGQKGDLFLASMTPEVTEAYELLQFSSILKSFPTVEQAIQSGFGKARAGKGPAKSQVEKAVEKPQAGKISEKPMAESVLERPRVAQETPRLPWFFRILMPWKWF